MKKLLFAFLLFVSTFSLSSFGLADVNKITKNKVTANQKLIVKSKSETSFAKFEIISKEESVEIEDKKEEINFYKSLFGILIEYFAKMMLSFLN
jgi:hypothetical protein